MIIDKEKFNRPFLSSYHHHRLSSVFFLTGSFVFDTTIQLLINAHHHHNHLYSIQRSISMFATTMIIRIWYNDPPWHPPLSIHHQIVKMWVGPGSWNVIRTFAHLGQILIWRSHNMHIQLIPACLQVDLGTMFLQSCGPAGAPGWFLATIGVG